MTINPVKKKVWSKDDKIFFVKMLQMPTKNGTFKSASEVSNEYGVSAKSLYQWLNIYLKDGVNGFNPKPRKPSQSKSKNFELQEEIYKIALDYPHFNATDIIKGLNTKHKRISEPTVQKILKERELHTIAKRLVATEFEFTKRHRPISKETLEVITKNNPYLDLLNIHLQINGVIFFIKIITLKHYFGKDAGYLLLSVDSKSLATFSQIWDGESFDVLIEFINDLRDIFANKSASDVYFESDDKWPFDQLRIKKSAQHINWLDSHKFFFSANRFSVALKEITNIIRSTFLRNYDFNSIEQLETDIKAFLFKQRISEGPLGYPTFGQSPSHLNKNNI